MKRILPGIFVLLFVATPLAYAETSEKCSTEIRELETQIAKDRKKPEFQSARSQQYLAQADQWLAQTRKHAANGDAKGCVSATKKGWATLIAL